MVAQEQASQGKVLKLVIFLLDQQRYGLRLECVERVLPMVALNSLPEAPSIALGVFNYHGRIIAALDLRSRFGRPSREARLDDHLLLANTRQQTVALPVDQVRGVQEVAIESVVPARAVLASIGYVEGLVPLSDGLLYIHDLDGFLSIGEREHLARALRGTPS